MPTDYEAEYLERLDTLLKQNPPTGPGGLFEAPPFAPKATGVPLGINPNWIPSPDETVVTSDTGAAKGSKLERFDLIPALPLKQLARHYGLGAKKYAARNWEGGYDWSLSYAAMQRHALAFWDGEDIDPETGTPHVICVAWHAFALAHYMSQERYKRFDDRPVDDEPSTQNQ